MTTYTKSAVKGVSTVFIISLIAAFVGYLVRLVLAKNLSVSDFGLFYAIFSFLSLVGLFKSLGLDKSLAKFIPEFEHEKSDDRIKSAILYVAGVQVVTNAIIISAVYLSSSYLSTHFFHNPQAEPILRLLAVAFFIDSFVNVLKFAFQGFRKMGLFANIDLVRMVLILIVVLFGFRSGYDILSPVMAYMVVPIILILIFGHILLKKVFPGFRTARFILERSNVKRIFRYSTYIMAIEV